MSLLLDDFDRWYETYEAASIKQQYELPRTIVTLSIRSFQTEFNVLSLVVEL